MKHIKLYEDFNLETWKRLNSLGLADETDIKILNIRILCSDVLGKEEESELKKQVKTKGLVRVIKTEEIGYFTRERWLGPSESIDWLAAFWNDINERRTGCVELSVHETYSDDSYTNFLKTMWLSSIERGIVYRS